MRKRESKMLAFYFAGHRACGTELWLLYGLPRKWVDDQDAGVQLPGIQVFGQELGAIGGLRSRENAGIPETQLVHMMQFHGTANGLRFDPNHLKDFK